MNRMLPLVGVPETLRHGLAPYREVFCRGEGFVEGFLDRVEQEVLLTAIVPWRIHCGGLAGEHTAEKQLLLLGRCPRRLLEQANGRNLALGNVDLDDEQLRGGEVLDGRIGAIVPWAIGRKVSRLHLESLCASPE
jgi:hypothetical protein